MTARGGRLPGRYHRGRRAALVLLLAVAAGLGVRLAFETPVFAHGSDHFHNLLLARSLAAGEGFRTDGSQHPDLSRPPAFPVLTAGLSWVTGDVDRAATLLAALSSALVVVPLFFLARAAFGARAALATLPLGALSGLVASAGLMTEPLFLVLSLASAAATWRAARRPGAAACLAAGALAAGAALARFEGLAMVPVLVAWAAIGSGRPRGLLRRVRAAGLVLVGFVALYGPYTTWVSARLGRFAPAPGVLYLQDMRCVSDRLGLRYLDGPWVEWTERSQYLATASHDRRVLDVYFREGVLPEPDATSVAPESAPYTEEEPPRRIDLIRRRIHIVTGNLRSVPYRLVHSGFLPVLPVALGLLGGLAALRRRRTRRALVYLATLGAASFAPILSHLEARFLYLPFAVGLVISAGGWGVLAGMLRRARGRARAIGLPAVHLALVALVAWAGVHHHQGHRARYRLASFRQEFAAAAARALPPGPIMAVQMHVPYWAGRTYVPIPVGGPELVLDFARAHGAVGLFFDSEIDIPRRPHLVPLLEDPPPAGFRLVLSRPLPGGGEARLFDVSSEPVTGAGASGPAGPDPAGAEPAGGP